MPAYDVFSVLSMPLPICFCSKYAPCSLKMLFSAPAMPLPNTYDGFPSRCSMSACIITQIYLPLAPMHLLSWNLFCQQWPSSAQVAFAAAPSTRAGFPTYIRLCAFAEMVPHHVDTLDSIQAGFAFTTSSAASPSASSVQSPRRAKLPSF